MGLLSDAEITAMRAETDSILPGTCVVSRATFTPDGHGGQTATWAPTSTVVCRLDTKPSDMETVVNNALNVTARYTMYFKYNADVTEKDRLVFGGKTYEVTAVLENHSWIFAKRANLARLKP